jgi:uncharacterized protein (DUF983 family)
MEQRTPPRLSTAIRRGIRRRCPRCGEGPLFRRWITAHERCSSCNLLYQRDQGDVFLFMVITDRIPLMLGIAIVYFGFRNLTMASGAAFFLALAAPALATLRQRQGVAMALDYLMRVRLGDPSAVS